MLGQLDKSDLSFVTDPDVAEILEKIYSTKNKMNFKESFPAAENDLITMLQSMLEFNPFFRKKPEEYLQMEIFESLRAKYPEMLVAPSKQIKLDVDQKNAFDYENSIFKKTSHDEVKTQLL